MKFLFLTMAVLFVGSCSSTPDPAVEPSQTQNAKPADRGNEIVADFLKGDASPFRKDHVRFTIRSEDEPIEVYELDVWRRQTDKQVDTLSIITKPVDDAGSGSLSTEMPGKPTVNVTYSESRKEFRESDTSKMFFGGLTAQELLGEWTKYNYKFVGEREINGIKAFEIEGKLKDGQSSPIAGNKITIAAEGHLLLEAHLFDNTGKELRTYNYKEIRSVNGRKYVAKTEAFNHIYNSKVMIEILAREFPAEIDDSFFSRDKLKTLSEK